MGIPPDTCLARCPLTRLLLAGALLAFPAAFASESLDEDFLLFLSDWTDDTGEFIPPSDLEEDWADGAISTETQPQPEADKELQAQSDQGEPDE
ncbi:hypothetical protein [Microbulbifer elongatus]|uniref:Uncharacterized protein n=1 Tax=Microbulbifer elongatus TaxID=86173 RepID=A0ABT1P354_9GAMM|nr:hypothetical protein [Microbulbifer elongatus]MCQ3829441.1 hypothetical protein [Microbulbifer elongatus]